MKNILYTLLFTLIFFSFTSCKKAKKQHVDAHKHTEPEHENTHKEEGSHEDEAVLVTMAQFKNDSMKIGTLTKQAFPFIVKTTGMIDIPPQGKEVISSFISGYVKSSSLLVGDKVRKGQALVTIENPDLIDMQQNYIEVSEELTYLKTAYERQKTLFEENITSQKKYQKAESQYKQKRAVFNALHKKLQMFHIRPSSVVQGNITTSITLYASINGSVTKVNVSKGSHVSPSDVILEIIDSDHIHIELTVFEKDAMKIKKGQKISFKIPEASTETFDAEVHLVGTSIDTETRTIKVHGHLHNEKENHFAVGMFVDATIEIDSQQANALPEEAVLEEGEHFVVLKLEKQENNSYIFEPIDVEIGENYNGFVKISSEKIKKSDSILIKGGYSLIGVSGGGHSH